MRWTDLLVRIAAFFCPVNTCPLALALVIVIVIVIVYLCQLPAIDTDKSFNKPLEGRPAIVPMAMLPASFYGLFTCQNGTSLMVFLKEDKPMDLLFCTGMIRKPWRSITVHPVRRTRPIDI